MFREQAVKADRLVADFLAHQFLAAGGLVAFVEQQVERLQHAVQPARQFLAGGNLEGNLRLADFLFGAGQALGDGGIGGQKGAADFRDAETAKGLQRERDLRFRGNQRMAADEHHAQAVVGDFLVGEQRLRPARGFGAIHQADDFGFLVAENFLAADDVEREVAGGAHDPGGGILRHAVERPGLQRAGERFLDHVFGEGEMFDAENPGQDGHHLSRLRGGKDVPPPGRLRAAAVWRRRVHGPKYRRQRKTRSRKR